MFSYIMILCRGEKVLSCNKGYVNSLSIDWNSDSKIDNSIKRKLSLLLNQKKKELCSIFLFFFFNYTIRKNEKENPKLCSNTLNNKMMSVNIVSLSHFCNCKKKKIQKCLVRCKFEFFFSNLSADICEVNIFDNEAFESI